MKNILLILLSFLLVSCANTTTQSKKVNPHAHVTIENLEKECQPAEKWRVGVLGLGGFVLRFDKCLDVELLLAVSADDTLHPHKITTSSIELLAMHYVEFLKRQDEKDSKRVYSLKKINEQKYEDLLTYFYSITSERVSCSSGTCKKKD